MYYKFSIYQNNIKKRNLQFERFFSFQYQNDSELLNVHVDISTPYINYSLKIKGVQILRVHASFFLFLYSVYN